MAKPKNDWKPASLWVPRDAYRSGGHSVEWVEREVLGETSRSWIIGPSWHTQKIPKAGGWPRMRIARTQAEAHAIQWTYDARIAIARNAARVAATDLDLIVKLAKLLDVAVPDEVERALRGEVKP